MSRHWIAAVLAIACIAMLGGSRPSPTTAPADAFAERLRVALLGARVGRLEAEANLLAGQRAKDDPKRLHELAGEVHSFRLRAVGITFADYYLQALKNEMDEADGEVKQFAIQLRRRQSDLGLGEEGGQGKAAEPVVTTDLSPAEGDAILAGAEAALAAAEKLANWNHGAAIPASCWPAAIAELDPVWVKTDIAPTGNITIFLRDRGGDEEGLIIRPKSSGIVPKSDAMVLVTPVGKGADGLLHPAPGLDARLYTYHRVIPMPQMQLHCAAEWESAFTAARAAPTDGFLEYAEQDGGWVLLVGRVTGGTVRLTTLPLPPKLKPLELLWGTNILGVGDGKAYFHTLNDSMDYEVRSMDLATGRTAAVPDLIEDFEHGSMNEFGWRGFDDLPPMQTSSPLIRGGRRLEWSGHEDPRYADPTTMPAENFHLLDLSVFTGYESKLAWTCKYTVAPNNNVFNPPPTIWLDADHVLTLSDNHEGEDGSASDHHVMVVDLKAHSARSVGVITGDQIRMIAPAGDQGDAILISDDGKGWPIDIHSALTAPPIPPAGKLAQRPAHWGLFTLESPGYAYGLSALAARRLLYNGKELASTKDGSEMIVSVSTDGKSVIWQKRWQSWQEQWKDKKDCLLFYYHAGEAEPRQIAKADILDTPVWYASHPVVAAPAAQPASH